MEIKEECFCSLPQLEATKLKKKKNNNKKKNPPLSGIVVMNCILPL